MKELTEFQQRIVQCLEEHWNRCRSTWEIAQLEFPEKWKKRSARGALIRHIRMVTQHNPDVFGWIGPKDQHDTGNVFLKEEYVEEEL